MARRIASLPVARRPVRRLAGAFLGLSMAMSQPALAAELAPPPVTADPLHRCTLELAGPIVAGDAERLADRLEFGGILCLRGPGGSYPEGVKLALMLHEKGIATEVRAEQSCLSACAIAFMGGSTVTETDLGAFPHRYLHKDATLGFHAPYLEIGEGDFDRESVLSAYQAAIQAIGLLIANRETLNLPTQLIEALLEKGSDDFEFVDTVDEAGLYKIGLFGYGDLSYGRALGAACWNANAWKNRNEFGQIGDPPSDEFIYENTYRPESTAEAGDVNVEVGALDSYWCKVKLATRTSYPDFYADYTRGFGGLVTQVTFYDHGNDDGDGDQGLRPSSRILEFPAWTMLPGLTTISDLPAGRFHDFSFLFL
ncbi:hypothetical protein [Jiella pacifica]|uniref:Uncharacterized protein n=1 Tax=Jiella pacifica TaxID=2696469 RepID=A0A6N9T245_9HYPH|nr:hypothetical protein [Jiella pacifica]NDW04672.1 hypothetical protein [Jiella pacifica]